MFFGWADDANLNLLKRSSFGAFQFVIIALRQQGCFFRAENYSKYQSLESKSFARQNRVQIRVVCLSVVKSFRDVSVSSIGEENDYIALIDSLGELKCAPKVCAA